MITNSIGSFQEQVDPFNFFPKQINKHILCFLPLHEFFRAKRICKKANECVNEVVINCLRKLEGRFPETCQILANKGWSQEKIISKLIGEKISSTGHIFKTALQICKEDRTLEGFFMKEILFWKRIIPFFKINFPDQNKNRPMPWPQNDQERHDLAYFFFQHAPEIESGKEIIFRKEQKIDQSNETIFTSFVPSKEWLKTKEISLIFQENLSPISSIALPEICVFNQLQNLNLKGNPYPIFPKILCKLTHLTSLSLRECHLEEIPEGVILPAIKTLNLWDNKLSKLPRSLQQSLSLSSLNLKKNRFNITGIKDSLYNENGIFAFNELTFLAINQNGISLEQGAILGEELRKKGNQNLFVSNR